MPDRPGVAVLLVTMVIVKYTYNLKYTRFSVQCDWRGYVLYSTGVTRLGRANESWRTEIKRTKRKESVQ